MSLLPNVSLALICSMKFLSSKDKLYLSLTNLSSYLAWNIVCMPWLVLLIATWIYRTGRKLVDSIGTSSK